MSVSGECPFCKHYVAFEKMPLIEDSIDIKQSYVYQCPSCGKQTLAHRIFKIPIHVDSEDEALIVEPVPMVDEFKKQLEKLINLYSKENDSNTPDFILARYMRDCLDAFNKATIRRDEWHSFKIRYGR